MIYVNLIFIFFTCKSCLFNLLMHKCWFSFLFPFPTGSKLQLCWTQTFFVCRNFAKNMWSWKFVVRQEVKCLFFLYYIVPEIVMFKWTYSLLVLCTERELSFMFMFRMVFIFCLLQIQFNFNKGHCLKAEKKLICILVCSWKVWWWIQWQSKQEE